MPSGNDRPLGKRAVDESSPRVLRYRKNGLDDGETLALSRAMAGVLVTLTYARSLSGKPASVKKEVINSEAPPAPSIL